MKRLLSDLLRASEAKEQIEGALEKSQREALELSQIILPLRKENANLTRENNSVRAVLGGCRTVALFFLLIFCTLLRIYSCT